MIHILDISLLKHFRNVYIVKYYFSRRTYQAKQGIHLKRFSRLSRSTSMYCTLHRLIKLSRPYIRLQPTIIILKSYGHKRMLPSNLRILDYVSRLWKYPFVGNQCAACKYEQIMPYKRLNSVLL